jgi:hypothetical protein
MSNDKVPMRDYVDLQFRHMAELRAADQRALQIKEQADRDALTLSRDAQTYKDEQANKLRDQISSERGDYVSRAEFKPIADYVTSQQGKTASTGVILTVAGLAIALLASVIVVANLLTGG